MRISALYIDIYPLLFSIVPAFLINCNGDPKLVCQIKVHVFFFSLFSDSHQRDRKYLASVPAEFGWLLQVDNVN